MAFTSTGAQTGFTPGVELKQSILETIIKQGAVDTPLLNAIGRGKATNPLTHNWLTDRYRQPKANAQLEISDVAGAGKSTKKKTSNAIQILVDDVKVSYSKEAAAQYGGKEMEYQTGKTAKEHARDLEFALLGLHFNAGAAQTLTNDYFSNEVIRTDTGAGKMAGIFRFIKDAGNATDSHIVEGSPIATAAGGRKQFTWDDLCSILQKCWENGAEATKVFVGADLKAAINNFAKDYLIHETGKKEFAPNVTRVATDFGKVEVVVHRLFTSANKLDHIVLAGDFKKGAKWADYIATRLEDVTTSETAKVKRFYTEGTLEVSNPDLFAVGVGFRK